MNAACVRTIFAANGLPVTPEQAGLLLEYERLLLDRNTRVNLVSRRIPEDFFLRHIIGSIAFLFHHPLDPDSSLLDAGTGGGLPGIPLSILYPRLRVTLVDSIQKKIAAVTDIASQLGLTNVRAVCSRVEEIGPGAAGRFDYVIARAVTASDRLLAWCAPLVAKRKKKETGPEPEASRESWIPTGSMIFLKGGDLREELALLEGDFRKKFQTGKLEVHPVDPVVPAECGPAADDVFLEKKVIILTP